VNESGAFLGADNGFELYYFILSAIEKLTGLTLEDILDKRENIRGYHRDCYLEKGLPGYTSGPTLIEIAGSYQFADHFTKPMIDFDKNYTFLYILNTSERNFPDFPANVHFLFRNTLEEWAEKFPVGKYLWLNGDPSLINDETFEELNGSLKRQLKRVFEDQNPALLLGAGVSQEYGVPSWNDLLKCIEETIIEKQDLPKSTKVFEKAGNTNIIIGQFVQMMNNDEVIHLLESILYAKLRNPVNTEEKTTLNSVAQLIKRQINKGRIPTVVSYNYDDLLEGILETNNIPHYPVTEYSLPPMNMRLLIYHPNGFLPVLGETSYVRSESVVFGEDQYNKLMANPYSWGQALQAKTLSESTCVFIGNSMTDPDLRLLLKKEQRTKHFLGCHYALMLKDRLGIKELAFLHRFLSLMGVQCVWFDSAKEERLFIDKL